MAAMTTSHLELEFSMGFHQIPGTMRAIDRSPICSSSRPK
jgi:hypothetical protein